MCSTPGRPPGSPSVRSCAVRPFSPPKMQRVASSTCSRVCERPSATRAHRGTVLSMGNRPVQQPCRMDGDPMFGNRPGEARSFSGPMINDAIRPACSAGGIGNPAGRDTSFLGRSPGCRREPPVRAAASPGREIWPCRGHVPLRWPARQPVITNWTNAIVQRHHGQHVCVGRRSSAPAR